MKVTIIFSLSLLMLSFITPKPAVKKAETYIYLASGFTNDTVSLVIDTSQVLKDEIVSSNKEHNDITDVYIKLANDSIFCYKSGSIVSKNFMRGNDKSVKILLTINNRPYSYTMQLKQGRYLFISKHSYFYNVYFNQFKKPVSLY
ncbi:MAG: hypothetical protein IT214_11925 [Chitinophagaceae bacterium]|nr:hypothetical protein [Chitinophagaceae bacterium]